MKKLCIWGFIMLILSCDPPKPKKSVQGSGKIKQMEWLIDDWENLSKNGDLYESWIKTNDSTYSGESYMIVQKDTTFSEKVTLELRNNELYYVPVISDQNNNQSVSFKFIADNKGEMTFENKDHDFPQRVIYKNPQPDSLYARVEGNENGKFRKEEFRMIRRK